MEYKGIRYSIRTRIVRHQWTVAIHPPDDREVADKVVFGDRHQAESMAHAMIDAWIRAHPARASGV